MRTITTTTDIYKLGELEPEAREKAIDNVRQNAADYQWWESVYDDAENVGIKITGFDVGRGSSITADLDSEDTAKLIMENHGPKCESYITAQKYIAARDSILESAQKDENGYLEYESDVENELEPLDDEFKHDILEEYLSILRKELEHIESDEQVIESIEANEYEFPTEGELI